MLLLFNKCTFYKVLSERKKILLLGDINSIHLRKWILGLKNDFDLTVFSLDPVVDETDALKGITIHTNAEKTTKTSGKLGYLKSIRHLRKIHRALKPDFVHSHYATSYGLIGALLQPETFYVSVWGSDVYDFPRKSVIHKLVLKWVFRRATKLFSTSGNMKLEIEKYTSKAVNVIPFGIDLDKFKNLQRKEKSNDFVVGTVKALEKVYGVNRLIESFAEFNKKYPSSRCIIYGKGSEEENLKKMSSELGMGDKIEFKGFIKHSEVSKAISEMDVFCILSIRESFGVAALEAAACKVPVIGSNVGGIPEVIIDNETGFLVDDAAETSEKILFLATNSEARIEMGKRGRQMVEEKYDWIKNVELMKSHYTE